MPTTIQRQQAKRKRGDEEILCLVDIAARPVLEDKGPPLPHIQVVKGDGVSGKEWHVVFTSSGACHKGTEGQHPPAFQLGHG